MPMEKIGLKAVIVGDPFSEVFVLVIKKINLLAPSESFSQQGDELIFAMLAYSVLVFVDPLRY